VPGETVLFHIDNTAGYDHSFWIGSAEELASPGAQTEIGIPTWQEGVRELEWIVPDGLDDLHFGSTVPGQYQLMQGCFSEGRPTADGRVERVAPARDCLSETALRISEGGPVAVPWARVALTIPTHWQHSVNARPTSEPWDTAGFAVFGDAGGCFVAVERVQPFKRGWEIAQLEGQPAEVIDMVVAGSPATRTDYVARYEDAAFDTSIYDLISPDGWHYRLNCSADDGYVPADRWLSIIETIEFLPAER
jgi:hypothetical protein